MTTYFNYISRLNEVKEYVSIIFHKSLFIRAFLFVLSFILFLPSVVIAEIKADHLVISEIQTSGGPGKTNYDFIELYNPTNAEVDLKGYRLVKRTKNGTTDTTVKSFTSSALIPARSFYLWANNDYSGVSADSRTSQTISDDNAVAVRFGPEDTGTVVDALA